MQIILMNTLESTSRREAEVLLSFLSKKDLKSNDNVDSAEQLQAVIEKEVFTADLGQVCLIPTKHGKFILYIGLGDRTDDLQAIKVGAASAARQLQKYKFKAASVEQLRVENIELYAETAAAIVEGFILGSYQMDTFALKSTPRYEIECLYLLYEDRSDSEKGRTILQQAVTKAQCVAEATNDARAWINQPGNRLNPEQFAQEARRIAEENGIECKIMNEKDILNSSMLGLHHVGKGSANPPRCIQLHYRGNPNSSDVLGLVGKGITFDTGGISLKKADGMEELIDDLGGAAAVLAVMKTVGILKPRVNITAVIPCAENMPSGAAYKPGDVIDTLSGKTIEVVNTDAEGRIVLADGITLAKQLGATRLIDVATLTGAVMVALGTVATGAVTNDDHFMRELLQAANRTGEKIWQLPVYDEFKEMIKSNVADVRNSCGRDAAAITAGLFIGAFAEDVPWIHLDIGGTVRIPADRGVDPAGGTGVMVRTLAEYILNRTNV